MQGTDQATGADLPIYAVALPSTLSGGLFIMPKPRPDRLRADLTALRARGVDLVLSLLEADEAISLGLGAEGAICAQVGLAFRAFPIPDYGVPTQTDLIDLLTVLRAHLSEGQVLAIHCRGGIGRSGMVASCLIASYGGNCAEVIRQVSHARGQEVPETAEQRDLIDRVVAEWVSV